MSDFFKTIFEDADLMVISKPAGLIVESENKSDLTLEKILEKDYHIDLPRSGIVHRLDRDTSGLMVIAKGERALVDLQNQFASHAVGKVYYALVFGKLEPEKGTISLGLKRDPKNRVRFIASKSKDAKEAVTKYEVIKKGSSSSATFLKIILETGRTHQIRAHFFAIGYPIIGDQVYKSPLSQEYSKRIGINRQFLHAGELSFKHPATGEAMSFKEDLPEDLKTILDK